jgi:hypothetical protein
VLINIRVQGPPLTLSQRLHQNRLEQQERENQHNAEIITSFIVDYIEPFLENQVKSCLSKTVYIFIPSGTEQIELTKFMPENEIIVEGFGGSETAGYYISRHWSKEYVKIVRLTEPQYSRELWQKLGFVRELEQTLKARLRANGEKLAETTQTPAGSWASRSFLKEEKLSPGYTGVELVFTNLVYRQPKINDLVTFGIFKALSIYVEIA